MTIFYHGDENNKRTKVYALFNIENLFDFNNEPFLMIENCHFYNLNENMKLFAIVSKSISKIHLLNVSFNNFDYQTSLIQFIQGAILGSQVKEEELFLFFNNLTIASDSTGDLDAIQNNFFCFNKINLKLLIQNSNFVQLRNSVIFYFAYLVEKSNITLINSNFLNFSNVTVIKSIFCSVKFDLKSILIRNSISVNPLFVLKAMNDILFQDFTFFDLKCSISNINMFDFSQTIFYFNNSNFKNLDCYSIFFNEQSSSFFQNVSFETVTYKTSLIYSFRSSVTSLNTCYFVNIFCSLSIFYFSESDRLFINQSYFSDNKLFSFFYMEKSFSNLITNSIFKNNVITSFWKEDQTCKNTSLSYSLITKNFIFSTIYKNSAVPYSSIVFQKVFILSNNSTSYCSIMITAGLANFVDFFAIQNYFLDSNNYQNALVFHEIIIFFKNSILADCGVIERKLQYQAFIKNTLIYLWYIAYASFENVIFFATEKIELTSGFISSGPLGECLEIRNSSFFILSTNQNLNYKGFIFDSPKKLILINNRYFNLKCNDMTFAHSHGAMYISSSCNYKYLKNNCQVIIENNVFENCSCDAGGSLAIISIFNINLTNCNFYNSIAKFSGGSLLLISNPTLKISNMTIKISRATEGGAIYIENSNLIVISTIFLETIDCGKTGSLLLRYIKLANFTNCYAKNLNSLLNGGFAYFFSCSAFINVLKLNNAQAIVDGGAFYIDGMSNITLKNLWINNCFGNNGAAFILASTYNMNFMMIFLVNVYAKKEGGVFLIENFIRLNICNFAIENAYTDGNGIIYIKSIEESAIMGISKGYFNRTVAKRGSCLFHSSLSQVLIDKVSSFESGTSPFQFISSLANKIFITNLSLIYVWSMKNLITGSGLELIISSLLLINNFAEGELIIAQNGVFKLSNASFWNNSNTKNYYAIKFEFSEFHIEFIIVENSPSFLLSLLQTLESNGRITKGLINGLFNDENSISYFSKGNIIFSHLVCKKNRGSFINLVKVNINIEKFLFYSLIRNTFFLKFENYQTESYKLSISELALYLLEEFSFILKGSFSIIIEKCQFTVGNVWDSKYPIVGFYLSNIETLNVKGSIFEAFNGRAVICDNEDNRNQSIFFEKTIFINNSASFGGALFFSLATHLYFLDCLFINNQAIISDRKNDAEGVGGCIYIKGFPNDYISNITLENNKFINNSARYFATSIFSQVKLLLSKNEFINKRPNNREIFSFPMKIICQNDYDLNLVSGKEVNLTFILLDDQNNTVVFDQTSIFTINIAKTLINHDFKLENTVSVISLNGMINFPRFKISIQPNTSIMVSIEGLFEGLKSIYFIPKNVKKELNLKIKECTIGHIILKDLSCYECPDGYFSLVNPMEKVGVCESCPKDAVCPGGYFINPNPGFYRFSFFSKNLLSCTAHESCLGYQQQNYNVKNWSKLEGGCKKGNSGFLCFYCDLNYGRKSKNKVCESCNDIWSSGYLSFSLYSFFLIVYIVFNCYLAERIKAIHNPDPQIGLEILNKFIVNHTQQISIIFISSNLYSNEFEILFEIIEYIAFSNPFILINDCILQIFYYDKESFILFKEILIMILPFFLAMASFLIWLGLESILTCKKRFKFLKQRIPVTFKEFLQKFSFFLMMSTFMTYSLILKWSFLLFDCQTYQDEENKFTVLKLSPNLICWGKEHGKYLLFGLPGLFVWGVSFPFLMMKILKDNINLMNLAQKKNSQKPENENISIVESIANLEKKGNNKSYSFFELNRLSKKINFHSKKKYVSFEKRKKSIFQMAHMVQDSKNFFFFYQDYKLSLYYWESLIFFRKFIISFIYTLNESISDEIKQYFMIFFIIFFVILTIKKMPFKILTCNKLELQSLYAIGASSLAHFFSRCYLSDSIKFWFLSFSLTINIAFLLMILFYFIKIGIKRARNIKKTKTKKISS